MVDSEINLEVIVPDVVNVEIDKLRIYENNPKKHPKEQIEKLKGNMVRYGFLVPIVISRDYIIAAGHGRFEAAQQLGLRKVPCVFAEHLEPEKINEYRIADNKLAELSEWDTKKLSVEFGSISVGIAPLLGFEIKVPEISFGGVPSVLPEEEKKKNEKKVITCPACDYEFSL